MSTNQMSNIQIQPALNGWIIKVGCATLVSVHKEVMLREIGRYIDDPKGVEKGYAAFALNQGTYMPDEDGPELASENPPDSPEEQDDEEPTQERSTHE